MFAVIEEKIQQLLNKYVSLDAESRYRLEKLNGKVVTIELTTANHWCFQLLFHNSEILLKSSDFAEADTVIKGTPLSLLHLSLSPQNRKQFFADDVSIEGNIELGQQIIALFDELEIDWEEYVSHWVGDVAAHNLGRFAKSIKNLSKNMRETLYQNINEFTHEEIQLFPPREALQDFFYDVDNLRMDVDRLDARIQQLMHSIDMDKGA